MSVNIVCVGAGAPGGCWYNVDGGDSSFGNFLIAHGGKSSSHGGLDGTFSFPDLGGNSSSESFCEI
ncbi:MAG: hypothetical protein ACXVCY_11795 [Pseudobdellovibrionaceae bacterium]